MTNLAKLPHEIIRKKILSIRGHSVLLDSDLAEFYHTETRSLIQAVKRNIERFPADFMYQLTDAEFMDLRSQNVISKDRRRYNPYAFTEPGVAMLSSVLKSRRAVLVNIEIIRAFVQMRRQSAKFAEIVKEIKDFKDTENDHFQHLAMGINWLGQKLEEKKKIIQQVGSAIADQQIDSMLKNCRQWPTLKTDLLNRFPNGLGGEK